MWIDSNFSNLTSKEEIDNYITRLEGILTKLKAHRLAIENAKDERLTYIGKYFIQCRYEAGTRYMYVLDCKKEHGYLSFLGYGAEWDEQERILRFIDPEYPIWFSDVLYGELKETDLEGLKEAIRSNIDYEVKRDMWWRYADSTDNS